MNSTPVKTTCPYCGVGCGVLAEPAGDRLLRISGDPEHPANLGRLCSKGSALGETVGLKERLLYPVINGKPVDWDAAINHIAKEFKRIIEHHGRNSIAFYVSGQLLTEDYYVANKFLKGFIGNSHIDSNSRLCMSSAVAGYTRAFGSDTVPACYEDIEAADLFIITGSNMAWCHPVLFQRLKAAQQKNNTQVVVIDPRRTDSVDIAQLHLPIHPGTDTLLFNGLLVYLADHGATNEHYRQYTQGLEETLRTAREQAGDMTTVAYHCGLETQQVRQFYELCLRTEKMVSFFSMGVNQSSAGTDKVNSIINCHLLTGRIGRPGMGPFSITGQPNAMGGREVGALSNLLAAHIPYAPEQLAAVADFWQAPVMTAGPGLKAVDLFRAIETGQIKAVWIMATNPVVSLPDADRVKRALQQCELVIASDCIAKTDTTALAQVLLPALGWGEKNGTVTNSERTISRQRKIFEAPGQAKPDWWIISQVAQKMGFAEQFNYQHPYQIFTEQARLSGLNNNGTRDYDISALGELTKDEYDALTPKQWPLNAQGDNSQPRFFSQGQFYTPDRKARLIPIVTRAPGQTPTEDYPLILNTGRIRDQWHTMTRTGLSPRLNNHLDEPFVQIHPADADRFQIKHQDLATISSPYGKVTVRAQVTDAVRQGQIFVPMHWSEQFSKLARVGAVINPYVDPVSGQPEFKHTPVKIQAAPMRWHGLLLSRHPLDLSAHVHYWSGVKSTMSYRYWLADDTTPDMKDWLPHAEYEWLEYEDTACQDHRLAVFQDQKLQAVLFIAPEFDKREVFWLEKLFALDQLAPAERNAILAGRFAEGEDIGNIVCACFTVGEKQIRSAIQKNKFTQVEQVSQCLKAGTNCGSCIPQIKEILRAS